MTYYGLVSGLPDPQFGRPLGYDITSLKALIFSYADENDAHLLHHFFYRIDLQNLLFYSEEQNLFLEGGNLQKEEIENWYKQLRTDVAPFDAVEVPENHDKQQFLDYLHQLWQIYYNTLNDLSDANTRRLWLYDISLRNFTAGHLFKKSGLEGEARYLEGGNFQRFDYAKLMLGDIQAEHPFQAATLACLEMDHPHERQAAMAESNRKFYDYVAFFEPFGISGLMSWLMKALEVMEAENYHTETGAARLKTFSENILNITEQQLI